MKTDKNLYIDCHNYCVEDAINYINSFVASNSCDSLSIDISKYNFLEATNICILSSTFSFNQNPENKITWIVNSDDTRKTINRLKLKNISLEVKASVRYKDAICV